MMVWLREACDSVPSVGLDDELISARDHARLVELDEACEAARMHAGLLVTQAEDLAAQRLARAQAEAGLLLEQAQTTFDRAAERGAEQGRVQALAQWWDEAAAALTLRRSVAMSAREQIAGLVVEAVGRIVRVSAPADLFARAAQTVERIIGEGGALTVKVRADEEPAARAAFESAARHWQALGQAVSVRMAPSLDLPPGSCICHTGIGTIDASLDVQLRALVQAVQGGGEQQG